MAELFTRRAHFQAFGFITLPNVLTTTEAAALADEADRTVRDATGHRYLSDDGQGGITGHYIPASSERTPVSVALLRRFAPLVEHLAGTPMIPAVVQHALLFDMAGWHTDTGHSVPSIKVAAYTEELDASNGALRVLPGSHRLDQRVLADLLHGPAFQDAATATAATRAVPAHVLASRPGDVIVFDEHLWHASVDGRNRHQWSASYVCDPVTTEEAAAVRRYLASQFIPGYRLDYDPTDYPHYGVPLRRDCPPHWFAQLDRLGALDAAAAEQARTDDGAAPVP